MATVTGASVANDTRGIRAHRASTLDNATEQEFTKIAGLPAKRRRPSTTWSQYCYPPREAVIHLLMHGPAEKMYRRITLLMERADD